MNNLLASILFIYVPYSAITIFLVGFIYRIASWISAKGLTELKTVAIVPGTFSLFSVVKDIVKRVFLFYTLPKMEKDRTLIVGSILFHYGIWFSLLGHLAMVVPLPVSVQFHMMVALYMGGSAGISAFIGILILAVRRLQVKKVRRISYLDDYFAISMLLALIILGLTQTLYIRPYFINTVSPWLTSIVEFRPEIVTMTQVSPVTAIHITLAFIFIAYIPFGKIVHIVAYLFQPTITRTSFKIKGFKGPEAHVLNIDKEGEHNTARNRV